MEYLVRARREKDPSEDALGANHEARIHRGGAAAPV
jgi:hypothetical protein